MWEEARMRIKEKYPDKIFFGRDLGVCRKKMLRGNQMDSVMNYVFRDAVRDYIAEKSISVTQLDSRLNHMLAYYKDRNRQSFVQSAR